jgi:hypothetical protein
MGLLTSVVSCCMFRLMKAIIRQMHTTDLFLDYCIVFNMDEYICYSIRIIVTVLMLMWTRFWRFVVLWRINNSCKLTQQDEFLEEGIKCVSRIHWGGQHFIIRKSLTDISCCYGFLQMTIDLFRSEDCLFCYYFHDPLYTGYIIVTRKGNVGLSLCTRV